MYHFHGFKTTDSSIMLGADGQLYSLANIQQPIYATKVTGKCYEKWVYNRDLAANSVSLWCTTHDLLGEFANGQKYCGPVANSDLITYRTVNGYEKSTANSLGIDLVEFKNATFKPVADRYRQETHFDKTPDNTYVYIYRDSLNPEVRKLTLTSLDTQVEINGGQYTGAPALSGFGLRKAVNA